MATQRRWSIGWGLGLVGVCGLGVCFRLAFAAGPADGAGYTPVAPARALQTTLQSNLKILRDWLNDKDFTSAAETGQGLVALAQLYGYQSGDPAWRTRTDSLRELCTRLVTAARAKDAARCEKLARDCGDLLTELGKSPPSAPAVVEKDFKAFGSTKTWMLLMEGAYVDAKTARSAAALADLAHAIAEAVNVASHLRTDAKWRTMALDVRAAALTTAAKARDLGLDAARRELKVVYQRCEACHQSYKR